MITTVGTIVVKELSNQALGLAVSGFLESVRLLKSSPYRDAQQAALKIENLIPQSRAMVIKTLGDDFDHLRRDSKTIDRLLEEMTICTQTIEKLSLKINQTVLEYYKSWWSYIYNIDLGNLEQELILTVKKLNELYDTFKEMLTNCLIAAHSRQLLIHNNHNNNNVKKLN